VILWLASGSPRRKALLEAAGYGLEVQPSDIDEARRADEEPVEYAGRLAREKAAVAPAGRLTVAADTVVHFEGRVFDKPESREGAVAHLMTLSGRWHSVTTGTCVRLGDRERSFTVTTQVRFRELTLAEVRAYVATGEADDKAGAYGIQGTGGALVAEVRGSWNNVVGLPLEQTIDALRELGGDALESSRGRH